MKDERKQMSRYHQSRSLIEGVLTAPMASKPVVSHTSGPLAKSLPQASADG